MRSRTGIISLVCLLWAVTAEAQLWRGPAALEIRAEDQKGGAVAGGQVKLVCRSVDPPDGPPPVTLDAKGRAVVGSLAEGKWHVEVSRDGYMTYQADLQVRLDEKPVVLSTLQLNVPNATRMMEVKIARARSAPAPAPVAVAAEPAPVRQPKAPTPAAPAPAAPAAAPTARPPVAPAPAPAAPAPVPAPTAPSPVSTAPPAAPAPPPAEPAARPAVPTALPAAPTAPPPVPTGHPAAVPAPSPVPTAPAPAAPAPAPAPAARATAPVVATASPVRHRSYEDRTCFECKPGEASISVDTTVPEGGIGCGAGVRDLLARAGGDLPVGCRVLRVTLPAGARYTGYRYEIQDGGDELDCLAGKDCPGGGRWPVDPALDRKPAGTTIAAAFESGPAVTRERHAVLTVYYTAK